MSEIIKKSDIKNALRKELTAQAEWPAGAPGISDQSLLYQSDATRSPSPTTPNASFGFTKVSGVVKNAVNKIGCAHIGRVLLFGRNVMATRDDRIKRFGLLADRVHLRLELRVTDAIGGTCVAALEDVAGGDFTITSPVPDLVSQARKNQFYQFVAHDISLAFPTRSSPIIDSGTIGRLDTALVPTKKISDVRDILLSETVADAINKKQF